MNKYLKKETPQATYINLPHQVKEVTGEEGGASSLSFFVRTSTDTEDRASQSEEDSQPVVHVFIQWHGKWEGGKSQHQEQLYF